MQSKAAKRYKRRLLAQMSDQATPEAIRSRVMDLERMSMPEIMALPPLTVESDQDEILSRAAVVLARVYEMSRKPGSQKAMGEALAKVSEDMAKQGASPIQRMALDVVGKLFGPRVGKEASV